MEASTLWRERPLFITSTFSDMHAERDYLRAHVFPVLEERLRERRHHFESIDLRWGVETLDKEEQHARELLVLKVCLLEVERSRPFLIGLLGDRYGWIPPRERLEAAALEAGFDHPVAGKSITEVEIDYGVMTRRATAPCCYFYFREPLPYDKMPSALAARYSEAHNPLASPDAPEKLKALKARIRQKLPGRWRAYEATWDEQRQRVTGLEAWGHRVLDDLWRDLDAETRPYARQQRSDWLQAERWTMERFVEEKARNFVGRDHILEDLLSFATSTGTVEHVGVCVTGGAGTGKSTLFAALHRQLERQEVVLLSHAAGVSPRSVQVEAMLRRWIEVLALEVGARSYLDEEATAEEVEKVFGELLGRAGTVRRVVVLIDALNQFEPTVRARHMTWLPKHWPSNTRLIALTMPCVASGALARLPAMRMQALPSLERRDATRIVQSICRRYHRRLNIQVLQAVLDKERADARPAASNPLWLALAVEALNLLDEDDFARVNQEFSGSPEKRLLQLLLTTVGEMPAIVAELYGWMLERAEKLFGKSYARAFVSLVTISRGGWRETDFRALMPIVSGQAWDALKFAGLRRSFRAHVVQRGIQTQWDFSHTQMRLAVENKYLQTPEQVRRLHAHVADYLAGLPAEDALHESERMVHLMGADDRQRAAALYGGAMTAGEKAGATGALAQIVLAATRNEMLQGVGRVTALLQTPGIEDEQRVQLCHRLNFDVQEALKDETPLEIRVKILKATKQTLEQLLGRHPQQSRWKRELTFSYDQLGDILVALGEQQGALDAYQRAMKIRASRRAQEEGVWQYDYSVSHNKIGDVLLSQGDLTGALRAFLTSRDIREVLVKQTPGSIDWERGLAASHERVGQVRLLHADLSNARIAFEEALMIRKDLQEKHAEDPLWQRIVMISHMELGDVLKAQGDLSEAFRAFEAARRIGERLAYRDPGNVQWQQDYAVGNDKVADVLLEQEDLEQALLFYEEAKLIRARLVRLDVEHAQWQYDLSVSYGNLGDVRIAMGDLMEARTCFEEAKLIRARLVRLEAEHAQWAHDLSVIEERIGDVYYAQSNLTDALAAYLAARKGIERLVRLDQSNKQWLRDLSVIEERIGDVYYAQSNLTDALAAYLAARKGIERLVRLDQSNKQWLRDLGVNRNKIGHVLRAQGNPAAAIEAYHTAHVVFQRLVEQNADHPQWQADLAYSYEIIGDLLISMRRPDEALQRFEAALAIREKLVRPVDGHPQRRHELSVSYEKVGDVFLGIGDYEGALTMHKASLDISRELAKAYPEDPRWQHDLCVSYIKFGEVLYGLNDVAQALRAFRNGMEGAERLAKGCPENASWQRDYWTCHAYIGFIKEAQGDLAGALQSYRKYQTGMADIVERYPGHTQWLHDLYLGFTRIAGVLDAQGDTSGAQRTLHEAGSVRERLELQVANNLSRR